MKYKINAFTVDMNRSSDVPPTMTTDTVHTANTAAWPSRAQCQAAFITRTSAALRRYANSQVPYDYHHHHHLHS